MIRVKASMTHGLVIAAAALWLSAAVLNRAAMHGDGRPGDGFIPPPPSAAWTPVFLGGFRGLLADGLWIRAARLQEQGRYFELVQLAEWITALEPEMPEVWAYQSWNMAYNISVLMPTPRERWRWVRHGLALLRDRALPATGYAPEIALELGQLFQYKIGGGGDKGATDYPWRWSARMRPLVGPDGAPDPARKSLLEEQLAMTLSDIAALESRYGRLDWRIAESHAAYWAVIGLRRTRDPRLRVRARRMLAQSLATLTAMGTLTEDRDAGVMVFTPDFDLIPGAAQAFEESLPHDPVAKDGYANWMKRTIRLLVFYGRQNAAEALFERLRARFPDEDTARGFEAFTRHAPPFPPLIVPIPGTDDER